MMDASIRKSSYNENKQFGIIDFQRDRLLKKKTSCHSVKEDII